MVLSSKEVAFKILQAAERAGRSVHRDNIIGRPYQQGTILANDGGPFSDQEMELAYEAFDYLVRCKQLRRSRTDISDPDNWVEITDAGKDALRRGVLDELDAALSSLDPRFLKLRDGMWSALQSDSPHRSSQAAHSGRELIDQILKEHGQGETKRAQIRSIMRARGNSSSNDVEVVEATINLVMALRNKLLAEAHTRNPNTERDLTDLVRQTECALSRLLLVGDYLPQLYSDMISMDGLTRG